MRQTPNGHHSMIRAPQRSAHFMSEILNKIVLVLNHAAITRARKPRWLPKTIGLIPIVLLQASNPEIAETHGAVMPAQGNRPLA